MEITDFKERIDEFYKIVFRIDLYWFDDVNDEFAFDINLDDNCDNDTRQLLIGFNDIKTKKSKIDVLEKYVNLLFERLFLFSHENNIFFNQCSFTVYESTFESRFMEYKKVYVDTKLIDFSALEVPYLTNNTCNSLFRMLNKINKKRVTDSTEKKFEFFRDKFEKIDALIIKPEPELEPHDLSDSNISEKIALLYELGIIDYLHKKGGKPHTVNSIATVLSGITGIKAKTIQSAINPFINTVSTSKGTPAKSTLTKAKEKIIDLGF